MLEAAVPPDPGVRLEGIELREPMPERGEEILTPQALRFVASLARRFEPRRRDLLRRRRIRQVEYDDGRRPDFPEETREVREARWQVAPAPEYLQDRRVEIVGPTDRRAIVQALNSGARSYIADFQDAHPPVWRKTVEGQANLRDAADGSIRWAVANGEEIALGEEVATLMVRPRGLGALERHVEVDGQSVAAAFFDAGLFLFHNARRLFERGRGACLYLAGIEGRDEARFWDDVFRFAEGVMELPKGTIRATVIVETVPAAFEMDEILFELRDHATGLSLGRWGYVADFLRRFRMFPEFVFPDRGQVTMQEGFLRALGERLIRTCHARQAHAMGGAVLEAPTGESPASDALALEAVRRDKLREVRMGHDGGWVTHVALVPVAAKAFEFMLSPNQIPVLRRDARHGPPGLLTPPVGVITMSGLRTNVAVLLRFLESWLRGEGRIGLYGRMEDASTAEVCRMQIWQWVRHAAHTVDGTLISEGLVRDLLAEEVDAIGPPDSGSERIATAARLTEEAATGTDCDEPAAAAASRLLE